MKVNDLMVFLCCFALLILVVIFYGFNVGIEERTAAYKEVVTTIKAIKGDCK